MLVESNTIVFRVDASLQIGTGHVMRCLTLADSLAATGGKCHFVCREHEGHLIAFIRNKGFPVHALPAGGLCTQGTSFLEQSGEPVHSHWLGTSQSADAEACKPLLETLQPDWVVVDHYALDERWHKAVKPLYRRMLVIDDLADRSHDCDVLLDQTYGRCDADYRSLVPADCTLLCGAQYALLRPEFAEFRDYSLRRRTEPALHRLLITMGGVDKDNATGQVLERLKSCHLPRDCQISVVMGATSPWLDEIREQVTQMPWPTDVLVDVSDMARLMAESDLAIGAAGTTSWERCCLGLPTIMLVSAENQVQVARGLATTGAALVIEMGEQISEKLPALLEPFISSTAILREMGLAAARIVDGLGVRKVSQSLEE